MVIYGYTQTWWYTFVIMITICELQTLLYFDWSPPWHFKEYRALVPTLSYESHCKTHSIVLSEAKSSVRQMPSSLVWWYSSKKATWYMPYLMRFFLTFEVRRGTLCSGARGWGPAGNRTLRSAAGRGGPAGNALILSLLFGAGGEHCDLELAVEVRRRKEKEGQGKTDGRTDGRKERGGQADIKSNNPHLTGGEKGMVYDPENVQPRNPTRSGDLSQIRTVGPFFGCEYIHIYIHTHWSYTCTYLCFWILSWFFSVYIYNIYIYL